MTSAFTTIYFKLVEFISTLTPFLDGILNQFGVKILDLSDATDPGVIIKLFFDIVISLIAFFIIAPVYIFYRIFMGLIGQPVPVPWF